MKTILVWDRFVRTFHWTLVAAVFSQVATAESLHAVHVWVGYGILLLVIARIGWGFVGTRYARFGDFVYPPSAVLAYLKGLPTRTSRHYLGHNPAGGAMVVMLLVVLLAVGFAGLKTLGAAGKGPLADGASPLVRAAHADDDHGHASKGSHESRSFKFWKEIHETLVGVLLTLVGIHVAGVLASSWAHRENLIKGMVTGRKIVP